MLGALNKVQIETLLKTQLVGRLGCYANGEMYIVPLTYVFDQGSIYIHTKLGYKTDIMRKNPEVCFEVDHIENMANWQSVIVWGEYEELRGKEADHALQILSNRLVPLITGETFRPQYGLHQSPQTVSPNLEMVVFRIKIKRSTGKYEKSS